ncbi:hypothetical protein MHM88_14490 [Epibacterium sp. MM17-32]|uniref:hypothetical protein n=1 Tax=Epibacterium sp. MM17-32 TaxID=2917734 RepID=UPI001EF68808|nr:hypothetical protein [Epibacterium sp. MM17-32]MCG7629016.1 hypothetical protein [Epibacterium sp. MM17-32]
MDLKQFIDRADMLETSLSERGFIKPEVTTWVRFCGDAAAVKVEFKYSDALIATRTVSPLFRAREVSDVDAAFAQLEAWIDEQPTPQQAREQEFTKTLAFLVEEGRALGSPILADLEATMKRLSENILEFQET